MRVAVIGCSGSFPGPDSPASCYLVQSVDSAGRTWNVLLDLGPGALGPLQAIVDPRELDAVIVSHLHIDHMADLASLLVVLKYSPDGPARTDHVPVYGPTATAERLDAVAGSESAGGGVLDIHQLVDGEPLRCGPITVTPYLVDHPVEAFAFRVRDESATLAFSGDTDECVGLDRAAAEVDLFLVEAAFLDGRDELRGVHLTGSRAGRTAARARARRTVLTHIPPWTPRDAVLAAAMDSAEGAPIELVQPGAVYEL